MIGYTVKKTTTIEMSSSPQVFTYTEEPQNYYNPPNFEYSKDETLLFTDKSIRIGFAR